MTQTYIEFICYGIMVSESSSTKVSDRSMPTIVPSYCFGFRFFDRTESEMDGEILFGQPKNYSHWFYLKGEVLTKELIKVKYPKKGVLISNMESNNINRVIHTKFRQFIPLEDKDIVLDKEIETVDNI